MLTCSRQIMQHLKACRIVLTHNTPVIFTESDIQTFIPLSHYRQYTPQIDVLLSGKNCLPGRLISFKIWCVNKVYDTQGHRLDRVALRRELYKRVSLGYSPHLPPLTLCCHRTNIQTWPSDNLI